MCLMTWWTYRSRTSVSSRLSWYVSLGAASHSASQHPHALLTRHVGPLLPRAQALTPKIVWECHTWPFSLMPTKSLDLAETVKVNLLLLTWSGCANIFERNKIKNTYKNKYTKANSETNQHSSHMISLLQDILSFKIFLGRNWRSSFFLVDDITRVLFSQAVKISC